jgi:hypothetical protein
MNLDFVSWELVESAAHGLGQASSPKIKHAICLWQYLLWGERERACAPSKPLKKDAEFGTFFWTSEFGIWMGAWCSKGCSLLLLGPHVLRSWFKTNIRYANQTENKSLLSWCHSKKIILPPRHLLGWKMFVVSNDPIQRAIINRTKTFFRKKLLPVLYFSDVK